MTTRLQNGLHRTVCWVFAQIVSAWPQGSRDWALAMQAELCEINNSHESLSWLAGGVMSLGKAWWNRVIFGWNDSEVEPSRTMTPGPGAIMLVLVALAAFILIPAAHEGFSAVISSWIPGEQASLIKEIQNITHAAEARHDANTLALVAPMFSSVGSAPMEASARMMDEAVNLDPSLTWIFVRGVSSPYVYYGRIPEKHGWAQKLEAWDPDNAMPYLIEANLRSEEIFYDSNFYAAKNARQSDPQWRAAMAKAFAAPRLDPYLTRAAELKLAVLKTNNMRKLDYVAGWWWGLYPGGIGAGPEYGRILLAEAREAMQRGDNAAALRKAWSVAHFAERLRMSSGNEIVQMDAEAMLYPAYEFLLPLEESVGHADMAKLLAIDVDAYARRKAARARVRMSAIYGPVNATGIALHVSGLSVAFLGSLLLLSGAWLTLGRFAEGLRMGKMYRFACISFRYTAAPLLASLSLLAFTYEPMRAAIQMYFSGATDPTSMRNLDEMYGSLNRIPMIAFNPMAAALRLEYFWVGILCLSIIVGGLVLARRSFRDHEPSTKSAA